MYGGFLLLRKSRPSVFPTSPGLADVAVLMTLCAAPAFLAVCRRSGSGCRDGAVGGSLCVASSLLAVLLNVNADVRWVYCCFENQVALKFAS